MRALIAAGILTLLFSPLRVSAQQASPRPATSAAKTPAKKAIPRMADGKPDLTGVWQGGSTQRGSWEEANTGFGVGGTGLDANAAFTPSSNDRPVGREAAPYQPWAAKKVLASYN